MKVFRKIFRSFSHENTNDSHKSTVDHDSKTVQSRGVTDSLPEISDSKPHSKTSKLHSAILNGEVADVKKYLNRHNVNEFDFSKKTPLHSAVIQNNSNIVKILLSYGASVEIYDRDGLTPFLKAVEIGNIDLVKIFCERKVNENQTDFNGNTSLHLAVKYGFYKITEFLVQNGAEINVANSLGDYPLHIATQNESFSIARLLVDQDHTSVDVEDSQKNTPLLLAVKIGNLSLVELFLRHRANREQNDIKGISVKQYAAKCKNASIKILFSDVDSALKVEMRNKMLPDEDSQTSEQSFVLPPILGTPKSWNVLHPKEKPQENKFKMYRRNVKSLSPTNESLPVEIRNPIKCNSLSNFQPHLNENNHESDFFKRNVPNLKLENCQKVLDELSLDVLHNENESVNAHSDDGKYLKLDPDSVSLASNKFPNNFETHFYDNVSNGKARELLMKRPTISETDDSIDSSSDDPPFWKNSVDGGYFTGEQTNEEKNKQSITRLIITSSSDDDGDDDDDDDEVEIQKNQPLNNAILNRLKQVTEENQDLETETAVLREAAEKLKFDLSNSQLTAESKEADLVQVKTQMMLLDSKYVKAIEKMNSFQLKMSNLEQEVEYLKQICDKSFKTNLQLMEEIKEARRSSRIDKSESNDNNIRNLEADVLYWKTKYEEISGRPQENQSHWGNVGVKNLLTLNIELNNLSNKVKDCLSKADVVELQNHQQIQVGKMMQQILDEADQRVQTTISEMKRNIELKVDQNESVPSDISLKLLEYENMKQKLSLEVSKLTALVKEKERTERRLMNQLNCLKDEVQQLKSKKRKFLINKAFEDRSSLNETQLDFNEVLFDSSPDYATEFNT